MLVFSIPPNLRAFILAPIKPGVLFLPEPRSRYGQSMVKRCGNSILLSDAYFRYGKAQRLVS